MRIGRKITAFDVVNYIVLFAVSLLTLYPFWYSITISLATPDVILANRFMLWPKEMTFNAYKYVTGDAQILQGFYISLIRVVGAVVIGIIVTALMAFPLSVARLRGKAVLFIYILIPMLFSGGLIPLYLLLKDLHMLNTIWVLIIPNCVSVFNIILLRNYFESIPPSLAESAYIDGAGELRVLFRIFLPLSMPIIATLCLFTGVAFWNDFFTGMIFVTKKDLIPLATQLKSMLIDSQVDYAAKITMRNDIYMLDESIKMAVVVISILPVAIVYPFLQKYFVKGIMLGAVKG